MRILSTILVLSLWLALPLAAQETFCCDDQTSNGSLPLGAAPHSQTFTVTNGGELSSISVQCIWNQASSLMFEVMRTTTSGPGPIGAPDDSNILFSKQIDLPSPGGVSSTAWSIVEMASEGIVAAPGEILAIRLTRLSGFVNVRCDTTGAYAGGDAWQHSGSTPAIVNGVDMTFQVLLRGGYVDDNQAYNEDWEFGPKGWGVTNGIWELGAPAQNFLDQAYSGQAAWMTDLDQNYPDSAESSVESGWFDFANASQDPVLSMAVSWKFSAFTDGFRLEMDLDDGNGYQQVGGLDWYNVSDGLALSQGLDGDFWGGGDATDWHVVRNTLTGAGGESRVRLRLRFKSDSTNTSQGAAFDAIRIEVPRIVVTASVPHYDGFELPGDGWTNDQSVLHASSIVDGPVFERGHPAGLVLGSAYEGQNCWGTNLDGAYPFAVEATLTSPRCDFSALATDPVLEFALRHDFATSSGKDGLRVEVDLNDGLGFQPLGTTTDWYDNTLSTNFGSGGDGFTGASNGWRILRHDLTGAATRSNVRIRFLFSSDAGIVAEGALIDALRIFVPTFKGTESTLADDIRMQVYVDQEREVGASDLYHVQAGEQIEVFGVSPEGALVGGEYYLIGEVFATGSSYVNVAADVWVSLGAGTILLQGGVQPPFYVPMQMGPYGISHFYYYGGGAAGYSCRVQALVFLPSGAANGLYASSDAFELAFD